ncbi:MAG: hypothetical protein JST16_04235 [Bdellovibrionales bacterium]|nr:hypothetical protein [Bdellovibrionales bacterium]
MSPCEARTFFALLVVAALSACTRKNNPPLPTPPPMPTALSLASLPASPDARSEWILELLQPRLSRIPNLAWSCDSDGAINIDFAGLTTDCPAFLKANPTGTATCTSSTTARLNYREHECPSKGTPPTAFTRLRLPEGAGLYIHASPTLLKSRTPELPDILFHPAEVQPETRLRPPTLAAWLAAASNKGAVALLLQTSRNSPSPMDSQMGSVLVPLRDFLAKVKSPTLLRPSLELLLPNASAGKSVLKLPLIDVIVPPQADTLEKEACTYLRRWIKTRQLLSEPGDVDVSRETPLYCHALWTGGSLPDRALVLAWLPLPLTLDDSAEFPFKTAEASLSPSLFQSLKILSK